MTTIDTAPPEAPVAAAPGPIAGFWRRLAAFLIDSLVLGVPTSVVLHFAFDFVVSLGEAGRLIGFVVALAYFGLLNGRVGDGQTVGKNLMGIRVTDRNGETLSTPRAMLRFLVLGVPYFANGVFINADPDTLGVIAYPIVALLFVVVFGGLGTIVYLYIFNRRTRQSLHDLAVGSFVVRAMAERTPVPASLATPRLHLYVVGCLFALMLALPIAAGLMEDDSTSRSAQAPLVELQRAIQVEHGIAQVGISTLTSTITTARSGTRTVTALEVVLRPGTVRPDNEGLQRAVPRLAT
jgi:uncharacterized RDD family membrane protein YckC